MSEQNKGELEVTPAEDVQLSEAEAHDEANMIRGNVKLEGNIWGEHGAREATAEDYETAARAIDELKEMVENEPAAEKVLYALARIGQTSGKVLSLIMISIGDVLSGNTMAMKSGTATMSNRFEETKTKFWDAARKLREAEKKGRNLNRVRKVIKL